MSSKSFISLTKDPNQKRDLPFLQRIPKPLLHTLIYASALAMSKGLVLIMVPVATHYLTPEDYGRLDILQTLADLLSIVIGMGLAETLFRFASGDVKSEETKDTAANIFGMAVIFGATALVISQYSAAFITALLPGNIDIVETRLILASLSLVGIILVPLAWLRISDKPWHYLIGTAGPIFFKQLRIGHAGHLHTDIFWMYKFRTMNVDAEEKSGAVWATKQDPRVTKFGKFLRKSRLDELPQLYNVLKGDMSIIGPRPERPGFYSKLEKAIPYFAERTWGLKPGITGLAQVNQGYDTSIEDVRSKVAFDHAYALSLSGLLTWIQMDIIIVFRTFLVMVGGRGQ